MVVLWVAIAISAAIAIAFTEGLAAALRFLGACLLPVFAVGGTKWSIIRGVTAQQIGGPIVGIILFAVGYWMAGAFSIHVFGHPYSGHTLAILSAIVGLTVPLAMGGPPPSERKSKAAYDANVKCSTKVGGVPTSFTSDFGSEQASSISKRRESRTTEQGARGSITFGNDERPTIRLSEDANASTFVYLFAMQMLDTLRTDAAHQHAPADLKRDAKVVLEWLGVSENHEVPDAGYERFARGFETFLMGDADNWGQLTGAFARIGGSLRSTYKVGDTLHPAIDDEIRGVFRRLFLPPTDNSDLIPVASD